MKGLLKRTGGIGLCLAAAGLMVFLPNPSWGRDLKDWRYRTESIEDEEFIDDQVDSSRTGRRRKPTRTEGTSPSRTEGVAQPVLPTTGEPTDVAQQGAVRVDPGSDAGPVVVQPSEVAPAEVPEPGKKDSLEEAREMLEKQLERLRKAKEEREKAAKATAAPGPEKETQSSQVRDVITLYLDPLEARPEVGKRFVSTVKLENHAGKEFDEIGFLLRYNPKVLQVVDGDGEIEGINVHDRSFRDAFPWERSNEYLNRVEPESGLISYRAKWHEAVPLAGAGAIASVTFEVLNGVDSDLSFIFQDPLAEGESIAAASAVTYVRLKGQDVLGRQSDAEDGAVDAAVKFYDYPEEDQGDFPGEGGQDLLTRIAIYPSVLSLYPGQEFDYVIEIDNPNRVEFDEVTLVLGYNPRYLKPIDHDRGNYISKGVNLFDGDYHETYPFNHHRRNNIDVRRGVIVYQMGTLRTTLSASGQLGSIRFRTLAPAGERGTRLKVGFLQDRLESGLTRLGEDVLGDPEEKKDGFELYPVYILPYGVSQK